MSRFARTLALGAMLSLGVVVSATSSTFDDDEEDNKKIAAAQKDVVELAKLVALDKKLDADKLKKIKGDYEELNHVMAIYKPRDKKGYGVGPKGAGDGIELKLVNMGKRKLSAMKLKAEAKDLIEMAHINIAMAELSKHYAPAKPKGGKGAADWNKYADEQLKASKELIDAVKKNDVAKVKDAAEKINGACNNCHSDFRDS